VIQYRRLAGVLLGVWLGAGVFADIAVTQNFQAVDRFLQMPHDVNTAVTLNAVGRPLERRLLRRNAAEENNWIFENWERTELAIGAGLFMLLLFGERPDKMLLGLCVGMFALVMAEHFILTPQIIDLGRKIDDLPPKDPIVSKFWMLHGVYSGVDILKLLTGAFFAARMAIRRKADTEYFAREYKEMMRGGKSGRGQGAVT
jgi:hypothetical protein